MNKEETNKSIIKKTLFLAIFLVSQELYLAHLFTDGLLSHYGYKLIELQSIAKISIFLLLLIMVAVCFTIVIYGLYKNKKYVKKFAAVYLIWAMLFPIWAMIILNNTYINLFVLIVDIFMILYLLSIPIKKRYYETSNDVLIKIIEHYKEISTSINHHLTNKHH